MPDPIRILLVDDHPVIRAGLRAMLDQQPDLEVVAEAADGQSAVTQARTSEPDVVLMDIQMPGVDGIEATRQIAALEPAPKVLILTTYDTDGDILPAIENGATGYLLKDTPPDDLYHAIRQAAAGETVLAPTIASRLVTRMRQPDQTLSAREIQLLQFLAEGLSNKEIGTSLYISEATVKTHLVHIFQKLGVDTRTAAVTTAIDQGLIRLH